MRSILFAAMILGSLPLPEPTQANVSGATNVPVSADIADCDPEITTDNVIIGMQNDIANTTGSGTGQITILCRNGTFHAGTGNYVLTIFNDQVTEQNDTKVYIESLSGTFSTAPVGATTGSLGSNAMAVNQSDLGGTSSAISTATFKAVNIDNGARGGTFVIPLILANIGP